jgi:pilus assembly protein CpaB
MRAISVKVNEVIGVAGFVIPGTRVDVLVTVKRPDNTAQTRIVLNNVTVLTAGTRFDQERATKEGKPIPTSVVTMLLTPIDAETMTLAAEEGRVMLALRNPLDIAPSQTPGARMAALLGEASAPPVKRIVEGRTFVKAAPPPIAPAPKIYTVETIRAAKRSEEEVR